MVTFLLIVNFALGIFLAVACDFVGVWCRKLVTADEKSERAAAEHKISGWLWSACVSVIIFMTILCLQIAFANDKEFKKIDARFETIEKQMTFPAVDTLYIKNLLKNE